MKQNTKQTGTLVIVGASSGLGHEIARIYARRGWLVGVCARRSEPLKDLEAEFPDNIRWETLDVTAPDSHTRLLGFIDRLKGIDMLLYAAGCGWNNPTLNIEKEENTVGTNVVGFTRIIGTVFNYMSEHATPSGRSPRICAITSIAGTKGLGISATYSASKRYQNTYLESLSQLARMRKTHIKITDIRPGFIDTALLDTSAHRYPMLMNVGYAARRIVRAIDRGRHTAYIDTRWHVVVALWRLIPGWLWRRLNIRN